MTAVRLGESRVAPDLRLAIPATVAWAAAACGIAVPELLVPFTVGAWATTVLALGGWVLCSRTGHAVLTHRWRVIVAMLTLSCCAAAVVLSAAATHTDTRRPSAFLEAARAGRFVVATATTTQTVFASNRSFTATIVNTRIGAAQRVVRVPVRVFREAGQGEPSARNSTRSSAGIGATISLVGRLKATAAEDSTAFLFFTTRPPQVVRPPPAWLNWANQLRSSFRVTAATLPGDGGTLLPGLAIGDTSAVSTRLDDAMKASSLSHLTAVSGANCAVVVGLVMVGGAFAGLRRRSRIAVSIAVLIGFVLLVTPEPSVLRAAAMATLVLLCLSTGRPTQGVPVLSLAVLVLLVTDPWLSREYGFVLSVLATGGLLVLSGPLAAALARWLPRPIALVISVPLAAQLACQPVIILLNPTISSYGLLANILAGLAAPVATVLGLGSCLIVPWWPWLGLALAHLAWVPSAWIAAVATVMSGLPGNQLPWLAGIGGLLLLAALTILVLVLLLATGMTPRLRRTIFGTLVVLIVGHSGVVAGGALHTGLTRTGDWQYALCDIGQGDAVLIQSRGKIALIDTGPNPERLTRCLKSLGVDRIDLLILTHYDLDHVGGVAAVVGRVGETIIGPAAGADDNRISSRVRSGGSAVHLGAPGLSGTLGELRWRVLWPPNPLRGVAPGNPASVIVSFAGVGPCRSGCLSALFLGDLGEESQRRLLTLGVTAVDVVKVAHHGSADQSARLYAQLQARVGLIGVGIDNNYGHPNAKLLRILADSSTAVARTDRDGLVLVTSEPNGGIRLWRERQGLAKPSG
ncbi:MAG: ComEC/Rec2 family competence protein [Microbacteriaceae bacterium]|nr:ComEC/Rec2 family competence protein [Microbacteriaceae bacterium]